LFSQEKDGYYTAQKHHWIQKQLLSEYTTEDHFLDNYLRIHKWEVPFYLIPHAKQTVPFPLHPTHRRRISLGVLLRRKRLSTSAPSGLDRVHLAEERQVYPGRLSASSSVKSSPWGPGRSKSTPFVHKGPKAEQTGELFSSPAFIKARQHSDAFTWGSIHRYKGREIAHVLEDANRIYDTVHEEEEPEHKRQHLEGKQNPLSTIAFNF
jgi:hypothetical protein